MSWDLTWQDPVALTLAVAGIWGARVLARRFRAHAAPCQKCVARDGGEAGAAPSPPTLVRLDQLRIGRPPAPRA
jgi:hypothetical protein